MCVYVCAIYASNLYKDVCPFACVYVFAYVLLGSINQADGSFCFPPQANIYTHGYTHKHTWTFK